MSGQGGKEKEKRDWDKEKECSREGGKEVRAREEIMDEWLNKRREKKGKEEEEMKRRNR